jgi:hypothetical protein
VHRKIEKSDVWILLLDASECRCNGVGDTDHDDAINPCQAEGQAFAVETCIADDDDMWLKI